MNKYVEQNASSRPVSASSRPVSASSRPVSALLAAAARNAIGGGSIVHWLDFDLGLHQLTAAAVPGTSRVYNWRLAQLATQAGHTTPHEKPEVHNVAQRCQMRTEPRQKGLRTKKIIKIGPAVLEICSRTDRHTDRQTDRNTPLPYWGGVLHALCGTNRELTMNNDLRVFVEVIETKRFGQFKLRRDCTRITYTCITKIETSLGIPSNGDSRS